jgi:hypothetical protein
MSDDAAYREFEDALSAVLAETEYSVERRSRLAKARGFVNKQDRRYEEAVDRAFDRSSRDTRPPITCRMTLDHPGAAAERKTSLSAASPTTDVEARQAPAARPIGARHTTRRRASPSRRRWYPTHPC